MFSLELLEWYHYIHVCTTIYMYVPLYTCTCMYHYIHVCITMYMYVPLCTCMYHYIHVHVCTTVYMYVLLPYRGYITLGIIFANFAKGLISRKLLSVKFYVPWSRCVTSTARCTRDPSIAANTGLLNLLEASQGNVGGHQWPHKLWFLVLQTADMERGMCPIVVSSWSRLIKQLRHKDRERCLVPLYTEEFLPGLVSKYPCKCDGHVLLNRDRHRK